METEEFTLSTYGKGLLKGIKSAGKIVVSIIWESMIDYLKRAKQSTPILHRPAEECP